MTAPRTAPAIGARLARFALFQRDDMPCPGPGDGPMMDDGAPRRQRFVASDETVDRYGDVIRANGWQLDAYRKNPVLLFGHQSRALPIGRVEPIAVEGTRLVATAEFAPAGMSAFADTVWQMVRAKILNAVSVGFAPLAPPNPRFDENGDWTGFEFVAQELLELSVVPVPANPSALQLAKSFALGAGELTRLFNDDGAAARIAAERRHRTIQLTRLGRR
jgi:HK97 family phage prohead protease